ncbi:hypothetical protein KA025_01965 [Candidatus Saccharibacteria bacterium]|nr:hypothetical protein [Candidatus Saccharibacteria bacterium]
MSNKQNSINTNLSLNQSGATAIMFAMFFIIVISLLTIGFATLVRKDQRAALDKTLSSQAEYAAESGVNAVRDYIEKSPTVDDRDSCTTTLPSSPAFIEPQFGANATITCYNWKNGAPEVNIDGLNFGAPEWIPFKAVGGVDIGSVQIQWTSEGTISSNCSSTDLNSVGGNSFPALRIITSEENLVTANVNYLCPSNSDVASSGNDDGGIARAMCSGDKCTATINQPKDGFLAVAQLQSGNINNVTIVPKDLFGNPIELDGIYQIDVTAKSQDIIKRVYSTIARGGGSSWSPGQFVVGTNGTLCKNYAVDGSSNSNAGPISVTACPR